MTTRAAKLKNLNSTRDTLRDYVNDVKTKTEDVLGKGPPDDPDIFKAVEEDLEDWMGQIELRWIKEDETNNDILASTSEDDFSVEMLAIENYNDHRLLLRNKIKRFMRAKAPEETNPIQQASFEQATRDAATAAATAAIQQLGIVFPQQPTQSVVSTYKPPKLRQFDGNIFEFQSWWESFDANVNSHATMPTATKFAFLDECLKGKAEAAIAKVGRVDAHYATAIQILKARFGNIEATIDQLIAGLLEIKPIHDSNDTASLRGFLDLVETNVGMLTNLGKDQNSYVSIVRNRLVSKLPSDLACMWHERTDRLTASMDVFVQFLTLKVVSRENYQLSLVCHDSNSKPPLFPSKKKSGPRAKATQLVNTSSHNDSRKTHVCVLQSGSLLI